MWYDPHHSIDSLPNEFEQKRSVGVDGSKTKTHNLCWIPLSVAIKQVCEKIGVNKSKESIDTRVNSESKDGKENERQMIMTSQGTRMMFDCWSNFSKIVLNLLGSPILDNHWKAQWKEGSDLHTTQTSRKKKRKRES